jgi:SAM-dependent methyltransferase
MPAGDDGYFGERIAATYDKALTEKFDPSAVDPVVGFLARLSGDGDALEFGIGTGRIALPLARRSVSVHGIDTSRAMVERLKLKQGDEQVDVTIGDFSTTVVDGSFTLVYLVFNTIMNLTTMASQISCFRNAAAHLKPGGHFVIEVMVPQLQRLAKGETLLACDLSERHWGVDEYDVVSQGLTSHHAQIIDGKTELSSTPFRYVWPAELDLMAQLAGLTPAERWADWDQEPFTADSPSHVSVWVKPKNRD